MEYLLAAQQLSCWEHRQYRLLFFVAFEMGECLLNSGLKHICVWARRLAP